MISETSSVLMSSIYFIFFFLNMLLSNQDFNEVALHFENVLQLLYKCMMVIIFKKYQNSNIPGSWF